MTGPKVVIISGVPGVGKTTTMYALSDALTKFGTSHGVLDQDALCQSSPSIGDYGSDLGFANLKSVWPNYQQHDFNLMLIARVVESTSDLDRFRDAIPGAEIAVVRVVAQQTDIDSWIAKSYHGDQVTTMQYRSRELDGVLASCGLESVLVENFEKSAAELGREALAGLRAVGFLPKL